MSHPCRTYDQVHSGLHWFYGAASGFSCFDRVLTIP